jgi:TatD DNase family protein
MRYDPFVYVDSHSHIEMDRFDSDRDETIQRALDAGVKIIVDVGNGDVAGDSHAGAFKLAGQYPFIFTTVGVHPHEARLLDDRLSDSLIEMSHNSKVIAWGEIGLDYYYDNSPRDVQRAAFRKQLRCARERGLPVVIHTRDAEPDTIDILREEWSGAGLPGIIHCFTGTRGLAEAAIEMGFYISFSGVVTFKKAGDLRETARHLPMDRILIETDSPFLAPVPFRGRRNEPAFVVHTARHIAELRDLSTDEIGEITSANFERIFRLRISEVQGGCAAAGPSSPGQT